MRCKGCAEIWSIIIMTFIDILNTEEYFYIVFYVFPQYIVLKSRLDGEMKMVWGKKLSEKSRVKEWSLYCKIDIVTTQNIYRKLTYICFYDTLKIL